ncbi:hypothetical protein Q3G72_027892 [Acer saccharum]|nr:hypothetical protein Q3G72_027892 [Acer saccharum]
MTCSIGAASLSPTRWSVELPRSATNAIKDGARSLHLQSSLASFISSEMERTSDEMTKSKKITGERPDFNSSTSRYSSEPVDFDR